MSLLDAFRVASAVVGVLVATLAIRHAKDAWQARHDTTGDPAADWPGIFATAIFTAVTAVRAIQNMGEPFHWQLIAYDVAYVFCAWSLLSHYRLPRVERLVGFVRRELTSKTPPD